MTSSLEAIALLAVEYLLVLGLAPILLGIIRRVKARSQRREGPSLLQPYRDLAKLWRKESVYSDTSSWVTRAAPWVSFAALLAAIPLVPWFVLPTPFSGAGDLIVLVGLLALSRFVIALAALDAGSTFGGMGSSREMWMGSLSEPIFLLVIFAFGAPAGSTQAGTIAAHGVAAGWGYVSAPLLLAVVAYVGLLLVETGRLPVDNPSTHLELTMVHEAMVLEYSGRDLALIEWGQGVKLAVLTGLLIALAVPWGISSSLGIAVIALALALLVAKLAGASALIGGLESRIAKWRLFRVADLTTFAAVLALGAIAFHYLIAAGA
ncbi:MAG: NADH-quinone oxidoreductase subunit H [Thermoplasmata archaeon]|nr:NADH-quinone oxidoreductase subunit H [Thermoplasmata archaeon]